MSLLSKLANVEVSDPKNIKQKRMTDAQANALKLKLRKGNRINVLANKFDVNKPYQVSINFSNKWHNFGTFLNIEVASAIGSLVSLAFFGADKAKKGTFNAVMAENDVEFKAWVEDPQNAEYVNNIELGTCVLETTKQSDDFDDDMPF